MGRPMGCYEISDGLAVSLGIWLAGMSYDTLGSYNYAVGLAIVCSLAGAAVAASLGPVLTGSNYGWEKLLPLEARSRDFFYSPSAGRVVRDAG